MSDYLWSRNPSSCLNSLNVSRRQIFTQLFIHFHTILLHSKFLLLSLECVFDSKSFLRFLVIGLERKIVLKQKSCFNQKFEIQLLSKFLYQKKKSQIGLRRIGRSRLQFYHLLFFSFPCNWQNKI